MTLKSDLSKSHVFVLMNYESDDLFHQFSCEYFSFVINS